MRLLRTQTEADQYVVETLTGDLMRWLRDEGRPTEGVEVLAAVPLLSTGDAAEYGVVLYRDADGRTQLWTARQFEDPWSAETALEVLEKRAASYRQKAAQTLEFVALAKRELPGQNGMGDAEKVALVEAIYAQRKGTPLRDTITTSDIARALGRDDEERAALAEAFRAADRDDVWLECANLWIEHCKSWKREDGE